MKVTRKKLLKDLDMDGNILAIGVELDVNRTTDKYYTVFVASGWWAVPVEYFEVKE